MKDIKGQSIKLMNATEEKILWRFDETQLFVRKKADLLLKINVIFGLLFFVLVTPLHFQSFATMPFLTLGDLLLILGMMISVILISKGQAIHAGTVTIIFLLLAPFVHNVIGDFFGYGVKLPTRLFETLIVICFIFPTVTSFSSRKRHIILAMVLSVCLYIAHFAVLKYAIGTQMPFTNMVYLVVLIIPGVMGLVNLKLTNEAIEALVTSRNQIVEWNKMLEQTVEERTKALTESNRKLEAMSLTDGLTGIANRRRFDQHYIAEWNRAKRSGMPLAVILLDLDQFKMYNDCFGHQQGDLCLQKVALKLEECMQRSGELAARYGGEEFAMILPGVDREEAMVQGERIRAAVEFLGVSHAPEACYRVMTVSMGIVAHTIGPEETPEDYFRRADEALYTAKAGGRNRVALYERPGKQL